MSACTPLLAEPVLGVPLPKPNAWQVCGTASRVRRRIGRPQLCSGWADHRRFADTPDPMDDDRADPLAGFCPRCISAARSRLGDDGLPAVGRRSRAAEIAEFLQGVDIDDAPAEPPRLAAPPEPARARVAVTDRLRAAIIEAYTATPSATIADVAQSVGASTSTAHRVLRQAGVHIKTRAEYAAIRRAQKSAPILQAYGRGLSVHDTAAACGVGAALVARVIGEAGVRRTPQEQRELHRLRRIRSRDLEALALYRDSRLSMRQVGAQLGVAPTTARTMVLRAGGRLRTRSTALRLHHQQRREAA